jgi:transposase
MGVSSRDMMSAMIDGQEDPEKLAAFARRTLKKKKEELELALRGNMSAHQRIMLKTMLTHVDFLNEQILELDTEVAKRLDPFQRDIERLDTVPGIGRRTAEQILAEVGTDVGSRFPSAAHLCSWAGLVPGQNESAGKRKSSKTRKGNKYLRAALIEVAHSVCRSDNYLGAQYRRIAARKGRHRAAVAVAHSIMTIVYYLLTRKEDYKDLGSHYFEQRQQEAIMKQAVRRLESLGFQVALSASEAS